MVFLNNNLPSYDCNAPWAPGCNLAASYLGERQCSWNQAISRLFGTRRYG